MTLAPTLPFCRHCPASGYRCTWQQDRNGRRRIRAECIGCGGFVGWLPQLEPWISKANRNASPTPLLDVLTRLDDLGAELCSDGRTVWVRAEDWNRAPRSLHMRIRQCSFALAKMIGKRTV